MVGVWGDGHGVDWGAARVCMCARVGRGGGSVYDRHS